MLDVDSRYKPFYDLILNNVGKGSELFSRGDDIENPHAEELEASFSSDAAQTGLDSALGEENFQKYSDKAVLHAAQPFFEKVNGYDLNESEGIRQLGSKAVSLLSTIDGKYSPIAGPKFEQGLVQKFTEKLGEYANFFNNLFAGASKKTIDIVGQS